MNIRYYVEFVFMPRWLFENPAEFIENVVQDTKYGMTKIYDFLCRKQGLEKRYTDKDFKLTSEAFFDKKLGENTIFRISMPEKGIEAPFCRDVFVTYCSSTGECRYLTVEYENEHTDFLGEVLPDGSHANFGVAPTSEQELIQKIKEIAFGKHIEEASMTVRNIVEYIVLPERFFEDRVALLQDLTDIGTNVIAHEYEFVAKKMNVPCPYVAEDFKIQVVDIDNKNGKFMIVLNMPRSGMVEKDALQVVMTMDYPNNKMRYFILEFSGTTQLYLCEILSSDGKFVRHGAVPKNPREILPMIVNLAFS